MSCLRRSLVICHFLARCACVQVVLVLVLALLLQLQGVPFDGESEFGCLGAFCCFFAGLLGCLFPVAAAHLCHIQASS